jgi:hypothetical protein
MPESVLLRYPCHLISTTYQALSHFHGDNTGSNPVGDAIKSITYKYFVECSEKRGRYGD